MGSSPSIMFPPRLTKEEFRDLFTENIYFDYISEKLIQKTQQSPTATPGTIERRVFVEYAMNMKDIYMYVLKLFLNLLVHHS